MAGETVVLIVAAGTGERFGGGIPKQYAPLLGKPVLRWSLDTFRAHPLVSNVYVAIHADHADYFANAAAGAHIATPIIGGQTRQETVLKALEYIESAPQKPKRILVHDAARPCVSSNLITAMIRAIDQSKAAVPGVAVTDSIRRVNISASSSTPENRDGLYTVQTPQAFAFDYILNRHRQAALSGLQATDDASLCDDVQIVAGDAANLKITHVGDIAVAEQTLAIHLSDIRTGQGYDVHRLLPRPTDSQRPLMIGGINIPHDKILEGHSDADVALHAITDAILGTICDGDIGMHFNPKNPQWKDADSAMFLRHAAQLLQNKGGVIAHIDLTIICEEPKIGPHRDAIRARIGDILSLPIDRISVKATTTEGLGFTGRREGIAAQSIVTARFPFVAG